LRAGARSWRPHGLRIPREERPHLLQQPNCFLIRVVAHVPDRRFDPRGVDLGGCRRPSLLEAARELEPERFIAPARLRLGPCRLHVLLPEEDLDQQGAVRLEPSRSRAIRPLLDVCADVGEGLLPPRLPGMVFCAYAFSDSNASSDARSANSCHTRPIASSSRCARWYSSARNCRRRVSRWPGNAFSPFSAQPRARS
jgi:hypothetical protein